MARALGGVSLAFVRDNGRWLGGAALLAFASSFGQTFFIALFAEDLRAATGLGHGGWGSVYALATIASAGAFMGLGRLADDLEPMPLAAGVFIGLAVVAVLMATTASVWTLGLAVFGLRLGGQAMMTHVAMTATARWFVASRGRAIALVSLGHPLGEALLPALAVALMALLGWRGTWWTVAALLLLVLMPLTLALLAKPRVPRGSLPAEGPPATGLEGRHWRRADVVRQPLFWALLPGLLASPMIGTALLFHGAHLVAVKGWSLEVYAFGFLGYALASIAGSLISGVAVDRYGAYRILPFYLVPLAAALTVAALATAPIAALVYLSLLGFGTGIGFTMITALWAELYGTLHLGSIRSLTSGLGTFATALGPGLTGFLLDAGIGIERQLLGFALVVLVVCAVFVLLARRVGHALHPLGLLPDRA